MFKSCRLELQSVFHEHYKNWVRGYNDARGCDRHRARKKLPELFCQCDADQRCGAIQIGYGSNKKTRHLMPSGHKAFLVHNPTDVDLLLMHNKTFAAEYAFLQPASSRGEEFHRKSHFQISKFQRANEDAGSHTPSRRERGLRLWPRLSSWVSRSRMRRRGLRRSHRQAGMEGFRAAVQG